MDKAALVERLHGAINDAHGDGVTFRAYVDAEELAEDYVLPVVAEFVESWIERDGDYDEAAVARAARWWLEMMPADQEGS